MGKILFISSFVPCDKTAGQNYTRLLLGDLLKEHTIDLICFDSFRHQLDYNLQSSCRNVKIYKVTKLSRFLGFLQMPFFHPFFQSRFNILIACKIRKLIKKEQYDWIYLDFSQSFVYGLLIGNKTRKILMCHDVISQYYLRRKSILSYKWAAWSERIILRQKKSTILSFSEKDKNIISNLYSRFSLVTSFYISDMIRELAYPVLLEDCFVFYGAWNRIENSESLDYFFSEIYPLLDSPFFFKIIGGGLPTEIKKKIEKKNNVEYVGFVDNPYEYLAKSKALIAPLKRGAGVKVKVIEAIACGCPVIGTDIAFEGISEKYKEMMFCVNSVKDYRRIIESIDVDISRRIYFRNLIINNCDDKVIVKCLKEK